jgi:hypothetical protein
MFNSLCNEKGLNAEDMADGEMDEDDDDDEEEAEDESSEEEDD